MVLNENFSLKSSSIEIYKKMLKNSFFKKVSSIFFKVIRIAYFHSDSILISNVISRFFCQELSIYTVIFSIEDQKKKPVKNVI